MSHLLTLAEHRQGTLREASLEALTAARRLSPEENASVLLGADTPAIAEELSRYASRVLHVDDPSHRHYDPAVWVRTLSGLVEREGSRGVVLPHSYYGMDVAGRLELVLSGLLSVAAWSCDWRRTTLSKPSAFSEI